MASSDRYTTPFATAWDAAGLVEAGAKLYFYVTGTSTPKDTYSDSALTTPNPNPVPADAGGRFPAIFLGSGDYKVTLTDAADVQIWTADPVAKAATTSASTTVSGIVELATTAEGLAGSSTTLVPPVAVVTEMIQQGFAYGTTGGTANAITGTPSRIPSALAAGMVAVIKATATNTGAVTFNWAALGAVAVRIMGTAGLVALAGGEIVNGLTYSFTYSAADGVWIVSPLGYTPTLSRWPRGYISGLILSRAGTTTYGVAVGECVNENAGTRYDMVLGSAFTKTLSAWAVGSGNGSLDIGAVGADTWYHVHLIRKDSDNTIDVLLSTSATSPTMPTGYTARRRLGSIRTNGSSQIIDFQQVNDTFLWKDAVIDVDATNPGTSAVTRTLTVPTGLRVNAILSIGGFVSTNFFELNITSLDTNDQATQAGATGTLTGFATGTAFNGSTNGWGFCNIEVMTNTSAQVRSRISASGAGDRLGIITRGWRDARGKD